jgi:hypothetical protein
LFGAAEWDRRAGHLGAVHRHHAVLQCTGQAVDLTRIVTVP